MEKGIGYYGAKNIYIKIGMMETISGAINCILHQEMKLTFYKVMAGPVMAYGTSLWMITKIQESKL